MADGAIRSLKQLSGAASYAVYYFAASKNPFGSTGRTTGKASTQYEFQGPGHRISH